jgi:hypothetical protein
MKLIRPMLLAAMARGCRISTYIFSIPDMVPADVRVCKGVKIYLYKSAGGSEEGGAAPASAAVEAAAAATSQATVTGGGAQTAASASPQGQGQGNGQAPSAPAPAPSASASRLWPALAVGALAVGIAVILSRRKR